MKALLLQLARAVSFPCSDRRDYSGKDYFHIVNRKGSGDMRVFWLEPLPLVLVLALA